MKRRRRPTKLRTSQRVGGADPIKINSEAYDRTSGKDDLINAEHAQLEYSTLWTDRPRYFREATCLVPHGSRNSNKVRRLGFGKLQPPSKAGLKK